MGRLSKKRQVEEDEASSDGEAVKPSKKTKTKTAAEADPGKDDEGNSFWALSATRRMVVQDFKGKTYINIREYYDNKGELKPGKKGIMLTLEQYNALVAAIPAANAELASKGHQVTSISASNTASVSAPESSTKSPADSKKKKKKKMNIEATSDEEDAELD
ncbi:putative transcriptional Coactivator p15 family protein [Rosellinia necatrix]|uniref:Putative transcriptional Coactivator p15 family protein n=1 Tax=Rosellinia necatrix TaxID=77044 RepID=A0A1W2TW09_ROSNE|nr:putative transcriptional Coactivator p15 family protein [Rosellinia necatrix]